MRNNHQLDQCFPENTSLIPPQQAVQDHPPIYMKLNHQILETLREQLHKASQPSVKLVLNDKNVNLRIGNLEFQGTKHKEHGHVEVYVPCDSPSANVCTRMGEVSSLITINQDKPLVLDMQPDSFDISQPTVKKILQLLVVKPHSISELAAKAHCSLITVKSILKHVAEPRNSLFVLKESYRQKVESETPESFRKEGLRQRSSVSSGSNSDNLEPKSIHTQNGNWSTNRKQGAHNSSTGISKPGRSAKRISGYVDCGRTKCDETKKPKLRDEDMFELARKFRTAYDEYLELYSVLQDLTSRPPSQVQKLLAMHNQLASWKKTLWSRSKQIK